MNALQNTPFNHWKWISAVFGLAFVIVPSAQIYIFIQPTLEMLPFIPISIYFKEMVGTFVLMNAVILAAFFFLIGGIFLTIGKRIGYILTIAASLFSLFAMLEVAIASLIAGQKADAPYFSMLLAEVYGMLGMWIILLLILTLTSTILLNTKSAREHLKVQKREFWSMLAVALFLILDLNACILIQFLGE
jgi:hypothetical protein